MDLPFPIAAHIALALIVLKSKPIDNTIEGAISFLLQTLHYLTGLEHIHAIREIIVDKTRKLSVDAQQYIDGTLFWKRAYEKSENEKMELQRKIFDLEQQLLKTQTVMSSPVQASRQPKRKFEVQQVPQANTQTKRKKLDSQIPLDIDKEFDIELDDSYSRLGCHHILRAVYGLRQATNNDNVQVKSIVHNMKLYCHHAANILKQACCKSGKEKPMPALDPKPIEVCRVLRKTIPIVFQCFGSGRPDADDQEMATCVSHVVHLFETMLGQLQQLSLDEADRVIQNQKRKKRRSTRPMSFHTDEGTEIRQISKALATTMACMFEILKDGEQRYQKLQQALICTLFDHIGSALSLAVFGDPATDKSKDRGVMAPQGLIDVTHIDTKTALLTVQYVSPFLIYMLRRALANFNLERPDTAQSPQFRNRNICGDLLVLTKDKLQHTLLRGMFGDEDEMFHEAFERADECAAIDMEQLLNDTRPDCNSPHWFIGQVWEHLGWELLAAGD